MFIGITTSMAHFVTQWAGEGRMQLGELVGKQFMNGKVNKQFRVVGTMVAKDLISFFDARSL